MKYFPKPTKELKRIVLKEHRKNMIKLAMDWFPEKMQAELMKHLNRPGWKKATFHFLFKRLCDEVVELDSVLFTKGNEVRRGRKEKAIKECLDIANFAMMIADNIK